MKILNSIAFNIGSELILIENFIVINCTLDNVILIKAINSSIIQVA